MNFLEIIKVIILGVVEGITEWLPISSTGHLILTNNFLNLNVSSSFMEMFEDLIQLGAIMAVVILYFNKLNPINFKKTKEERLDIINLWLKVAVASVPAAIVGFSFKDFFEEHFNNYIVVALMLIIYGILFIVIENKSKGKEYKINSLKELTYRTCLAIGLFQVLSIIPGTSRSGATILGAMIIGTKRDVGAEFTFFLAIPVICGASLFELLKFGFAFTTSEIVILLLGMAVSFITSFIAIKFLVSYVKKHDFKVFGYYRIILGIIVLLYYFLTR